MAIVNANSFGEMSSEARIKPSHGAVFMGCQGMFPPAIARKLEQSNHTGTGNETTLGKVIKTGVAAMPVLDVVNTYLIDKLTPEEMQVIMQVGKDRYGFQLGVGDRREDFKSRFSLATNWSGGDVQDYLLPEPWTGTPHYNFRLTFSREQGMIKLTDNHAGENNYGAIRCLLLVPIFAQPK
ncbi:hypothetical protein GTL21_005114 [Salmonella enterica]|nr:hypothetical protein [Salmonella enterica]HBM0096852.1 hypothetical protein [Salmonella enterica subsp. enterica serovar Blitta]